jgi:sortase A
MAKGCRDSSLAIGAAVAAVVVGCSLVSFSSARTGRDCERTPHVKPGAQATPHKRRRRCRGFWLLVESLAWAFAIVALSIWGAANLAGIVGARQDLERFEVIRAARVAQPGLPPETEPLDMRRWDVEPSRSLPPAEGSDMTLWARGRIHAWQASLTRQAPPPLAILRIPNIRLEVAVLPGTDTLALNRGVGHIEDTAMPGTDGNAGIAGHRDGFFRGLKDITTGDVIELETLDGRLVYHVERTWIVDPQDVSVLAPTSGRSLTLVTCYPFYSIGPAPQRFIVRAIPAEAAVLRGEVTDYGDRPTYTVTALSAAPLGR